jgi:hypothetical protein
MNYTVTLTSTFPGTAAFVQLINRAAFNGLLGSSTSLSTGGQFWLDAQYPFSNLIAVIAGNRLNVPVLLAYTDNPGIPAVATVLNDETFCDDNFQDYVVFKPKGNSAIYVTLGVVQDTDSTGSWDWWGSTIYDSSSSSWTAPGGGVTPPLNCNDNSNFPCWTNTYISNQ